MTKNLVKFNKVQKKYGIFEEESVFSIDLKNDGLFILASGDSNASFFLFDYIQKTIKDNKFFIITDRFNGYPKHSKIFSKFEETTKKNYPDKTIEIKDFEDFYKEPIYSFSNDVTLIDIEDSNSTNNSRAIQKKNQVFFPKILDNICKYENSVVIFDSILDRNIKTSDLISYFELFKKKNIDFIVFDYSFERLLLIENFFNNQIYFQSYYNRIEINKLSINKYFPDFERSYTLVNDSFFRKAKEKKTFKTYLLNKIFELDKREDYIYERFIYFNKNKKEYINNLEIKIDKNDLNEFFKEKEL